MTKPLNHQYESSIGSLDGASASISALIDGLVSEAAQAPRLFSDLAKLEMYIAESYKTRALIELLQNADDAGATEFVAQCVDDGLVVANNGRVFTIADVEALCRSGASNKQRGGATIGCCGIGFKSVVNLAERVYVFSGEHRFVFDRERTRSVLGSDHDVPLIRIPHLVEVDDGTENLIHGWRAKYPTVFYFGSLDAKLLHEDVGAVDGGCLLFLNPVSYTHLDVYKRQAERDFLHPRGRLSGGRDEARAECADRRETAGGGAGHTRSGRSRQQTAVREDALEYSGGEGARGDRGGAGDGGR